MEFTKTHWNNIIKTLEKSGYTILNNIFDGDDFDSCEIIASLDTKSIRIKFEYDNIGLDVDDINSGFGTYYEAVEQMDPVLFAMCIDTIIDKLSERYK